MTRLRDLADGARVRFEHAGIPRTEAALDAELLLRHLLDWDRAAWLTRKDETADAVTREDFEALVARRERREPVAFIRGIQEFFGRDFVVRPGVLIPRPETEIVVDEALQAAHGRSGLRVADVGTGSGCLAVTLALELPAARVVATDVSDAALHIAHANAVCHDVAARMRFVQTSYLDGIAGPFDLVVSNPPYVRDGDAPLLQPEVREYEPSSALFGGSDGLRDVRRVVEDAADRLAPGGALVMEIGAGQAADVRSICARARLQVDRIRPDLQGIARVVVATRT